MCAIYFSLNFEQQDFVRAKLACISLLRHLPENRKCMIFIGTDQTCFEILVPPKCEDELDDDFKNVGSTFFPKKDIQVNKLASIAKFSSINTLVGLDLGNFFFGKNNIDAAARTIEKLKCFNDTNSTTKGVEISATLSRVLNGIPLHFISIIEQINNNLPLLESIHQFPTRIDFLISKYTKHIPEVYKNLQGTIQVISTENPVLQAEQLFKQKTAYKLISMIKCSRAGIHWKKTPKPFSQIENSVLYTPICLSEYQSYPFEVTPLPNQECYNFQVISKYITEDGDNISNVIKVISISLKSSNIFDDIINNINWNCVLWNWSSTIINFPQNYALNSIYSASSILLKEIKNEKFIHAITTFIDLYITSNNPIKRLIGTDILLYMNPTKLNFVPNYQEQKYYISPNGIFTNNPNLEIDEITEVLPIYLPINNYIPNYLINPNQEQLHILESIIKKN